MKRVSSIVLVICFIFSLVAFSSCGGGKEYSRVKSGSGMGNKSDKNKHVWGK